MKRLLAEGILVACVVFAACAGSAQVQQAWVAKYNNNGMTNGSHQALKLALDSIGNIYVLGVSANANTNTGYVVVKYAPNGSQIWASRYDSTNFPASALTGFAVDNSNAVVVTGNAVSLKYDAGGNQLWVAPYSGQAVAVDTGQNSYVTGVSNNFTTIKLNPAGSNLWSQTWTYQGLPNLSQAIALDSFSNVYVAGKEEAQADRGDVAVHLGTIKYDAYGNQLWEVDSSFGNEDYDVRVVGFQLDVSNTVYIEANYLGGEPSPYSTYMYNSNGVGYGFGGAIAGNPTGSVGSISHSVVVDSQGNIVVTGGYAYAYPFEYTYATYKLGTNGSYIWTNLYPTTPKGSSIATSVAVDQASSVFVTGLSTNGTTTSDIVTIKYDSNGNQQWLQRYDEPGHGNDAGNAIAVDNSGNVYVAGYETETTGFTSMILIKYVPVPTIQKQINGNFVLDAYGSPGETFDIQVSTNLQSWVDLGDIIAGTNGIAQFDDTNAALFGSRFYYAAPK
jgi:hypothetical protein